MTYELAKELKDAGFPQVVRFGDVFYAADKGTTYLIPNSDDYDGRRADL